MDKDRKYSIGKWLDILITILCYILVQYVMICFTIAFQHNILCLFLFPCDMYIISVFSQLLSNKIAHKGIGTFVSIVCTLAALLIYIGIGYFPISTTLEKVRF